MSVLVALLALGAAAAPSGATGVVEDPPPEAWEPRVEATPPVDTKTHPGTIGLELVGSYPEELVVPPASSPLMSPHPIKRDCGFSVRLSGGRTLWLYCDTTNNHKLANGNFGFNYFFTSSAAIAYDSKPLELREAADTSFATPRPYPFLVPPTGYNPCPNTTDWQYVLWPSSATRVPYLGGRDRVLMWYTNYCRPKGAGTTLDDYVAKSIGVAEWIHDPTDPAPHTKPIQAKVLHHTIFPIEPGDDGSWGEAAVYSADGFVYLYRCASSTGCTIGRVAYQFAHDPTLYKFWNGTSWVADRTQAVPIDLHGPVPPQAFNVVYLPQMNLYAMSGFAPPGSYLDKVHLRVAPSVMGPWGPPLSITIPMCSEPPGCYAGHVQPQLSGPDSITISAYHWWHYHERGGQVVTQKSRIYLDPPLAGLCQSGFYDVGYDHMFCKEIRWYGAEGITNGYADGSYRPTIRTSRQVMAQWFYNWNGNPAVPLDAPNFSDVPADHPFGDAIRWAAAEGITVGFPDGTFRPTRPVARQTMAAWFYRVAGEPAGPFDPPPFTDVPPTHQFYKEISWFAQLGITAGYPDGTFRPVSPVSRQGVAAFFYNYTGQP